MVENLSPQITNSKIVELTKTYWAWRRLWIATTFLFGAIGLTYVLFLKTDHWTASQGLIVRDEANGAVMRLGRFQSQTEMKAAQETILEMARNGQVLREALLEVGPHSTLFRFGTITENWPSQKEVAQLADEAVGVRAPKGAEFGTTEVIYLDIKQDSRERALALNKAVCNALDNRLRQVRMVRTDGVIDELTRAGAMASDELRKATEQLQIVEREAGPDLSDLRGLSESNGSGSSSRQLLDSVRTELRQLENQHNLLLTDYNLLLDTQSNPDQLLSAPASIMNAHPGLKKLREGLADAQLQSSQLRGRFTSSHPLVYVAITAENEIRGQLHEELSLALSTAGKDVENSQARIDNLKRQQRQLEERLERLARIRADHENLNNEVRARTRILQDAERQLADAQASRDAAVATSLLTRLDEPVLGEHPVGPGRTTILAGMTLAGLFFGLGIVFLLTPLDGAPSDHQRWNETLGRRISDRFPWLADQSSGAQSLRRRRSDASRRHTDRPAAAELTPSALSAQAPSPMAVTPVPTPADAVAPVAVAPVAVAPVTVAPVTVAPVTVAPVAVAPVPVTLPQSAPTAALVSTPVAATPRALNREPDVVFNSQPRSSSATECVEPPRVPQALPTQVAPSTLLFARKPSLELRPQGLSPTAPATATATVNSIATNAPAAMVRFSGPVSADTATADKVSADTAAAVPGTGDSITAHSITSSINAEQAAPALASQATSSVMTVQPMPATPAMSCASVIVSAPDSAEPLVNQQPGMPSAAKPGMNMFRPNQVVPQRPRPVSKPATQPSAKPEASARGNEFQTPIEGGLAGIGLPTQPLPEGFRHRQQPQ